MIIKSIHDVDQDDIQSFTCGNIDLDEFLKKHAKNNDLNGYGKTFVLVDNDAFIGFFTLCSASIAFEEYPASKAQHLPKYPIPCIRIARLAVDKRFQGEGYGKELLKQAFLRILNVYPTIGIRLVVVDAKQSAASFYEKYGFVRLQNKKLSYFLPIETIIEAFK